MKIAKRIKATFCHFFLIIVGMSSVSLSLFADTQLPQAPLDFDNLDPAMQVQLQQHLKKIEEEYLEEKIKPILKAYEQIDFICEHLAQVIHNHQVRNAREKEAIVYIKNLRQTLQEIKKGSYIVLDPYSVKALLALAEHIIELLEAVIKNNLTTFPEPALQDVIKRSLQEEAIDFDLINQRCTILEKRVKDLDDKAQHVGLNAFNKGYRSLEKLCTDYKVSKIVTGLLVGAGIYWILSPMPKSSQKSQSPLFQIPKIPIVTQQNPSLLFQIPKISTVPQQNPSLLSKIPKFDTVKLKLWADSLIRRLIIPGLLIVKPIKELDFKKDIMSIQIWAQKKWDRLRSYFRGGPLEKRVETWKKEPRVRFKDIVGKEHHKNVLGRVIDYIRDHERFDRAGIAPEAGYLLAGPTRTGKTYLAEALAGEIKDVLTEKGITEFDFLVFNAADIKLWGINTIMNLAKESAPCVLFIDEIDMCGWQRERDAEGLSQVLTAMSGCMNKDRSKTVIVVGATNKPENLDFALLQKGRFGKVLWFDYPTLEDREIYLRRELENRSIMSIDEKYLKKLAQETDRCSFDDLNAIVVTALQKSKAEGQVLTERHLEEAFDEEIRHVLYEKVPMTEEQKRILAVHQAGHTIATLLLDETPHITKVTIKPINTKIIEESVYAKYYQDGKAHEQESKKAIPIEYGKMFSSKPQHADTINTHQELLDKCKIELAGHVAEKLILGSSSYTYHRDDKENAHNIALYIAFEGMRSYNLPKQVQQELQLKAYTLMQECEQQVHELLQAHKDKLDALAKALQEKETLASVEILEILGLDQESTNEIAEQKQTATTHQS